MTFGTLVLLTSSNRPHARSTVSRSSWAWNRWRWGMGDLLGSAAVTLLCTTETAFGYFWPVGRRPAPPMGISWSPPNRQTALIP